LKIILKISSIVLLFFFFSCKDNSQNKQFENKEIVMDNTAAVKTVNKVMSTYKEAIQNLKADNTLALFTKNATVFESGGSEGAYENYLSHHLGPELKHFNSFIFSDYIINTQIDFPFAFVTETYVYTIDIKENKKTGTQPRIIKKKGVATTNLKKIDGNWKITRTHTSSRNIR